VAATLTRSDSTHPRRFEKNKNIAAVNGPAG
jgi:hypothetical protein